MTNGQSKRGLYINEMTLFKNEQSIYLGALDLKCAFKWKYILSKKNKIKFLNIRIFKFRKYCKITR